MENATKALLIAAAVLVAILIISLGLVVYNMAAETMGNVNLSENEVKAFNDKFTRYESENTAGTNINALVSEVFASNMEHRGDEAKIVEITGAVELEGEETTMPARVPSGNRYSVKIEYNSTTRLVETITVTLIN